MNNQERLGQPFDGFEVADPSHKLDKPQDSYAAQVHGTSAQKNGSAISPGLLVDLSAEGGAPFLTVSQLDDGRRRFTVRVNVLFNENTAEYRSGSAALLDRLDSLLKSASAKNPIQVEFVDDTDVFPGAEELHIERVAAVTAYLALKDATEPED